MGPRMLGTKYIVLLTAVDRWRMEHRVSSSMPSLVGMKQQHPNDHHVPDFLGLGTDEGKQIPGWRVKRMPTTYSG
jgi:hypothetical protein